VTEREKAAAGFLYDANYDEELARQRAECKDKCHRYNLCLPSDTAQQDEIMRGILGKAGKGRVKGGVAVLAGRRDRRSSASLV